MPVFQASLYNGSDFDCILDDAANTITINDDSNYTVSDEAGNLNPYFSDFRKIIVTSPNGNLFTFSSLVGGDVTIPPGDSGTNQFVYNIPSDSDGVYSILLETVPTWKLSYDMTGYPVAGTTHVKITIDSVVHNVVIGGNTIQDLIDGLNTLNLGSWTKSGFIIFVVGIHTYGNIVTYDISNNPTATYSLSPYNNVTQVYYAGNLYSSLQNANAGNQPDTNPSWWKPITEAELSTKYTSSGDIVRIKDIIICKIKSVQKAACEIGICKDVCSNDDFQRAAKLLMLIEDINYQISVADFDKCADLIGEAKAICNC